VARSKKKFDWKILLLLPVPLLWVWLAQSGQLQTVENLLLDLRFRFRGEIEAPVKVFYVDVDTRAIQRIGERPWNRARFADAAQLLLEQGHAKAVGFDFVFSDFGHSDLVNQEDATKGNFALARVARKHPELILAAQYTGGQARTQNGTRQYPLLRKGFTSREKNDVPELPQYPMVNPAWSATIGLIDIDYEYGADQMPRWAPLFAESAYTSFWHLGVQLACIELGVPPGSVRRNGDQLEIFGRSGEVLRSIPLTEGQLLEINWFSLWDNQTLNPRSSMADVLIAGEMLNSEKPAEKADAADYFKRFAGAIVLVGPVDPLLQDLAPTPFDPDPVPKIGGHGNLIKTIIAEKYLHRPPAWVLWASVFGLSLTVTALTVMGGVRSLFTKVLAVLVLTGFVLVVLHQFAHNQPAAGGPGGRGVLHRFHRDTLAADEGGKAKGPHQGHVRHLPRARAGQPDGRFPDRSAAGRPRGDHHGVFLRHPGVLHLLRGHAAQEAGRVDERIPDRLHRHRAGGEGHARQVHRRRGGRHLRRAAAGARTTPTGPASPRCACRRRSRSCGQKWTSRRDSDGKWPPKSCTSLRARLGLNTGSAIIGNMGSRTRFSYTMMGDNVNLAARMESGAKSLGAYTMVTEATKLECEKHGGDHVVFRFSSTGSWSRAARCPCRSLKSSGLKENVSQQTFDCLGCSPRGMARYLAQDWDGALQFSSKRRLLEPHQPSKAMAIDSNPSTVYDQNRCQYMKEHPRRRSSPRRRPSSRRSRRRRCSRAGGSGS
jgi:adenylate cyclase